MKITWTHVRFHVSEKSYSQYPIDGKYCTEHEDYYEVKHRNFITGEVIRLMRACKKNLKVYANTCENPTKFEALPDWWAVTY